MSRKVGESGYDPAYKYDMAYKVLCHNVNAFTYEADLDQCADETTLSHNAFGEPNSGLLGRILNKPGVTKGLQTVMLFDVSRWRPRAYVHQHKLHPKFQEVGWGAQGSCEVRRLLDSIAPLVQGELEVDNRHQIFKRKPVITADNYFSGDIIYDYVGRKGFGLVTTVQRGQLPAKVPKEYWCSKESTTPGSKVARAARFNKPITATKTFEGIDNETNKPYKYTRAHCSFQSTSSCNIQSVNALNSNGRFIVEKQRGKGDNKRRWAIVMNDFRQYYLKTYGQVDAVDQMIQRCHLNYISWKYWHSAVRHADAIAIVVAYDMYVECATEPLAKSAFSHNVDKLNVLDFYSFQCLLGKQLLSYHPLHCKYPGDKFLRSVTKMPTKKRGAQVVNQDGSVLARSRGRPSKAQNLAPAKVSYDDMEKEMKKGSVKGRFCCDITSLSYHTWSIRKIQTFKSGRQCYVCGETTTRMYNLWRCITYASTYK